MLTVDFHSQDGRPISNSKSVLYRLGLVYTGEGPIEIDDVNYVTGQSIFPDCVKLEEPYYGYVFALAIT